MVKLIWMDHAIDDLQNIGDYIAEHSKQYARLTVKRTYGTFLRRTKNFWKDSLNDQLEGS
jgi:plasmid stabilization system protein ParE